MLNGLKSHDTDLDSVDFFITIIEEASEVAKRKQFKVLTFVGEYL